MMRRAMGAMLRRPFRDPMSGMYAVGAVATELLSRPYTSGAPEVEALMRVTRAGLRLEEVPVRMRASPDGKSMHGGIVKPLYYVFRMSLALALVPLRSEKR